MRLFFKLMPFSRSPIPSRSRIWAASSAAFVIHEPHVSFPAPFPLYMTPFPTSDRTYRDPPGALHASRERLRGRPPKFSSSRIRWAKGRHELVMARADFERQTTLFQNTCPALLFTSLPSSRSSILYPPFPQSSSRTLHQPFVVEV
jgi:hypothetical protein